MKSVTTERFRKALERLPDSVQTQARKAYELWQDDPSHPSLEFKRLRTKEPIYSVRVGIHWRAIGVKDDNAIVWFWIGSHSDYDKLLESL